MLETIVTVLVGLIVAACAAWVAQHVLGSPVGWLRGILLVGAVYALTVPIVRAALEAADVMVDGQLSLAGAMGYVFLAVALGWQFAIAVTIIMLSELFWPSGRGLHPIRSVKGIIRRRKRMRRYAQILRIASRHGINVFGNHGHGEEEDAPAALVAAMNEAGVTFVKIGQVLSTRDDLLPPELTKALSTLQMQTTPLAWPDVRTAIESELGGPLDATFAWIDETPLAAASLAQVHAARLVPDDANPLGADVVVKVQRPDARASVLTDLDIVVRLAAQAERRTAWARAYGLSALAEEFARSLKEELDYRIELSNTELLRGTLARSSVSSVHVPQVYPLLCTQRMMVQERIEGVAFSNLDGGLPATMTDTASTERVDRAEVAAGDLTAEVEVARPEPARTARDIADDLVDTMFEQIAVRGIFHADLHPGNIILRPDGQITLIDFGSVGILERSMRRVLIAMMSAMSAEDDIALTDLLLMITGSSENSGLDRNALQHDIGVVLTRVHNGSGDDDIFREVIDVLRRRQLTLPPALVLVFRTIGSMQGALRRLVPGYDMVDQAMRRTPHFVALTLEPKAMLADARAQLQLVGEQLRRLPRRIETIGSQLENGTFGMSLSMFRDARERGWIGSLVGQFTTALIGVVLIIAAVVLAVFGSGPSLTPEVGLMPFLGAIVGLGGLLLVLRALRGALMRRDLGA